jgi:hypothetical protein
MLPFDLKLWATVAYVSRIQPTGIHDYMCHSAPL